MATPSRLDDVAAALVAIFTSAGGVTVYDGPAPTQPNIGESYALVGNDGDPTNPDTDAASTDRDWSSLGNRWVQETGEVVCCVAATSGDTDITVVRARAFALFALLEAALLADPTLGGLTFGEPASIPSTRLRQTQNSQGCAARLVFVVRYQALLN